MVLRDIYIPLTIIFVNIFTISCKEKGSLTFVIDETDSMRIDIGQVKDAANSITRIVLENESSQIENFVLVTFNDPPRSEKSKYRKIPAATLRVKTGDPHELTESLKSIWACGGGDCPEMAFTGIQLALNQSRMHSYLYVFTDASPKDYKLAKQVIIQAQKSGSPVVFIITPSRCREREELFHIYYKVANATFGQVFRLNEKNEVKEILGYVKETTRGDRTVLTSALVPPATQFTAVPFVIDDQTEYAVITASGRNVELYIAGVPSRLFEKITWIENAKVGKLATGPGSYKAMVKGSSLTTVMVFARTDFTFQNGFSQHVSTSLKNTEKQPTDGYKYHLIISVNDPKHSVDISSLQILDMEEKLIQELPLKWILGNIYTTKLFLPPQHKTFLIAIIGQTKSHETIRRIAKTPIESLKKKFKPIPSIEPKKCCYEYNSRLSLSCKVSGYPEPKIIWKDENNKTLKNKSSVSTPPYEYISYLTVPHIRRSQKYICLANNDLGTTVESVNITVNSPFVIQGHPEAVSYIFYGYEAMLNCNIKSEFPMKITWYRVNPKTKRQEIVNRTDEFGIALDERELKINKMDLNIEGQYICKAWLRDDKDMVQTFTYNLKIKDQEPLFGEPMLPKLVTVNKTSTVTIRCNVIRGYPIPEITWQIKSRKLNKFEPLAQSDVLNIENVDLLDSGHYRCIAKNNLGTVWQDVELVVRAPPEVTLHINNKDVAFVNVEYGSKLSFLCKVNASPKPIIIWKNSKGNKLELVEIQSIKSSYEYTSEVEEKYVKRSEKYHCEATNEFGKSIKHVNVNLILPFTSHEFPSDYTDVEYGKNAVLRCNITSQYPMKIVWLRAVGSRYESIPESDDKYTSSPDETELRINRMDLDLQGQYACKAYLKEDNEINLMYYTDVKIVGLVAPQIKKETISVNIRELTPVILKCIVYKANPKPKITWQFRSRGSEDFKILSDSSEELNINSAVLSDAGVYRCIAKNVVGQDEHKLELIVNGPPRILQNETDYTAVEGDLVLRIPCNVIGYPKPAVAWTINGTNILNEVKYDVEEQALVINNPIEADTNKYTCKAENDFGKDEKTFDVSVTKYILDEDIGNVTYVYILKGSSTTLKCPLRHIDSDTVKWYKEGVYSNVTVVYYNGPVVLIENATENDDGNYTCRASNRQGAKSHTLVVDVGYPPHFRFENVTLNVDWNGDIMLLDCGADLKPMTDIKWTYNGKVISSESMSIEVISWGNYTCSLSNNHGSIERSFRVMSSSCLIKKNPTPGNTPLLLSDEPTTTWHKLKTMRNYIVLERNERLKLSCYNHTEQLNSLKIFPKMAEIVVNCDHEDKFIFDNKTYRFSDLLCNEQVLPSVENTGEKCLNENTEIIKVGFHVPNFVEVYKVCFDKVAKNQLYTQTQMYKPNTRPVNQPMWLNYPKIGKDIRNYNCSGGTVCCLAKSQLIDAQDVQYGPAQTSTFIDRLNSIPRWRCDDNHDSWSNATEYFRAQAKHWNVDLWSGASHFNKNGTPRYLWKVGPTLTDYIAVVNINDPAPVAADVLCGDHLSCPKKFGDSFTYCCTVTQFSEAFGISQAIFKV